MHKHYHFIGIGGIGMSGLARILLERKETVSGSDLSPSPIVEKLKELGAKIAIGQSAQNISPSMTVIVSSDIKKGNPELVEAERLKCKILHRSEMLQHLMEGKEILAISGTHGKTTTTSLLSTVLYEGGKDPSFCIGGILPKFQSNARHGEGNFFVVEADESDGSFLNYHPSGAIVTNIGLDHMDHYKTEDNLISSFRDFMGKVRNKELLFWCGDDARLRSLHLPGVSYGFGDECELKCLNFRQVGWNLRFDIQFEGKAYRAVEAGVIGRHNALNVAAVFGLSLLCGASEDAIRQGLLTFPGVLRRCEKKGEVNSVLFLDDYAHHPTEIQATLHALRKVFPERRLIAVFQPHRFTRTRDCMGSYGPIFQDADLLVITEIFSAGESEIPNVSSQNVLKEITQASKIECEPQLREEVAPFLARIVRPDDVVITLGAGNITKAGPETIAILKQ